MNKDNALAALWMLHTVPIWTKTLCKILVEYGSPLEAYRVCQSKGLDPERFDEKERALFSHTDLTKAKETLEYCLKSNIDMVTYGDEDFPVYLKNIPMPPVTLFVKGKLPDTFAVPSITIVGTRECSEHGKKLTAKLAYDLSKMGFIIVSGLARGIDTYAHKGCLMANASPTVAVLAGPVEDVYPRENKEIYNMICQTGAVVSETMPHGEIGKWAFHQRNRILSGLTLGTVVVESGVKGGSMITAAHALDQNKLIFAIPGAPGDEKSEGTNKLIQQGAILCGNINDILMEYRGIYGDSVQPVDLIGLRKNAEAVRKIKKREETQKILSLTEEESLVYHALAENGLSADELCGVTALSFPELISVLQALELTDMIEQTPGGIYIQKHI